MTEGDLGEGEVQYKGQRFSGYLLNLLEKNDWCEVTFGRRNAAKVSSKPFGSEEASLLMVSNKEFGII